MRVTYCFAFMTLFLISIHSYAQTLDNSSATALEKTQSLLQDPTARQKAIHGNSKAEAANSFVNKVTGGNTKQSNAVYGLAASVFANVVKDSHGDPVKMQQELNKFSRDPAGFAATWTPAQREKLKELSRQLPTTAEPKN